MLRLFMLRVDFQLFFGLADIGVKQRQLDAEIRSRAIGIDSGALGFCGFVFELSTGLFVVLDPFHYLPPLLALLDDLFNYRLYPFEIRVGVLVQGIRK